MDDRSPAIDERPNLGTPLEVPDLIDRLAAHNRIGGAPRHELEWLAAHGHLRHFAAGDLFQRKGELLEYMIVMLVGHGGVYIDRGRGRQRAMDWQGGDVSGVFPYSRVTVSAGQAVLDQETEALLLHRDHFPELIRECPVLTTSVVHAMLDRVRHFTSTDWQDDKMVSLGRLAAGLSHELNNPASAASRSASLLADALTQTDDAASALVALRLTDAQRDYIDTLRLRLVTPQTGQELSAIERADREEEITEWLRRRHVSLECSSTLSETKITIDELNELAATLAPEALDATLRWLAAGHSARSLARDVERATTRIHDLVSAVKRFTYMDRPTAAEPADVVQALQDTVAVLAGKARDKGVAVNLDVPDELPLVPAYGGELNQVWSNLIENALDAVAKSGHVTVCARSDGDSVIVRVIDDGPGIPADLMTRIFDPFFTTKPVGQNTGLGLDIARRIVRRHDGQIEVQSRPGETEFRVSLPAHRPTATCVPEPT